MLPRGSAGCGQPPDTPGTGPTASPLGWLLDHSRYWSNSQPSGLTPSSSGGGKNKLRQGECAEPAEEAGLDGRAEEEQWTAWEGREQGPS